MLATAWGYFREVLYAAAAGAAVFALVQWYLEANDRKRERLVQEVQVLQTCLDPTVRSHTKDRLWSEGSEIAHGEREFGSETTYTQLAAKCLELGFQPSEVYPET